MTAIRRGIEWARAAGVGRLMYGHRRDPVLVGRAGRHSGRRCTPESAVGRSGQQWRACRRSPARHLGQTGWLRAPNLCVLPSSRSYTTSAAACAVDIHRTLPARGSPGSRVSRRRGPPSCSTATVSQSGREIVKGLTGSGYRAQGRPGPRRCRGASRPKARRLE